MKTLHGEGYLPPRPQDTLHYQGNLYYRDAVPDEQNILTEAAAETLSLETYQQWVEAGWKTPFRTAESADRLFTKLGEEWHELVEAYNEYTTHPDEASRNHLAEEAGDVMWVMTAIASNGGMVVSTMTHFALAPHSSRSTPTVNDLTQLARQIPPRSIEAFATEVADYGNLGRLHLHLAAATPLKDYEFNQFGISYAKQYPRLIAQLQTILASSGLSLGDAIKNNIQKLSHRRTTNTIDKSDPGRSTS